MTKVQNSLENQTLVSIDVIFILIASEDLLRNEQEKALSLRKKKFDEFFMKKRLHGVFNPDSKDNSQFFLEIQKTDLTIPKEQQLTITSLVHYLYNTI